MIQLFGIRINQQKKNYSAKSETNKDDNEEQSLSSLQADLAEKIMDNINDLEFESEEEEAAFNRKIQQKIDMGERLTSREMSYLSKTNPYLYRNMVRVQAMRDMLKERLKHCRSKEEAKRVVLNAMGSVGDKDPFKKQLYAAISNVDRQFSTSRMYKKLPATDQEYKKLKKTHTKVSKNSDDDPFEEDEPDEGISVTYCYDSYGYQEAELSESTEKMSFSGKA